MADHDPLTSRASAAGKALMRLVNLVSHRTGTVSDVMEEFSVTLPQIVLMSRIEEFGSISPSDLTGRAGVSASAMSQMIDRLVRQGLLSRTEDPADRRCKRVGVTQLALSLLRRIEAARSAQYAQAMASLSPQLRSRLVPLLRQAIVQLERRRAADPQLRSVPTRGKAAE